MGGWLPTCSFHGMFTISLLCPSPPPLQRTALSVNIKERLDFSCALFGPDGGLVANAPHIPVHLGAMQEVGRGGGGGWGGAGAAREAPLVIVCSWGAGWICLPAC